MEAKRTNLSIILKDLLEFRRKIRKRFETSSKHIRVPMAKGCSCGALARLRTSLPPAHPRAQDPSVPQRDGEEPYHVPRRRHGPLMEMYLSSSPQNDKLMNIRSNFLAIQNLRVQKIS